MQYSQYYSACNDTKWLELRALVLSFSASNRPKFRSKCITNGYTSKWDGEWFYHFVDGGFKDIEWFELKFEPADCWEMLRGILEIGLVGEVRDNVLRVYGYVPNGHYKEKLSEEDLAAIQA